MSGCGNHRFGIKLEDTPSHKSKETGCHWNKGFKHSAETKHKQSETRKGSGNARAYKVYKYDVNLNLIAEYDYAKLCAEENEINYRHFIGRIIDKREYKGHYYKREKIC
jgi:hypothetical protein